MDNVKAVTGSFFAIGGTTITYLVGGWDQVLKVLALFMVIDYLTGLMKGIKNNNINSSIGFPGIFKKIGIIIAVIVAHQLDLISPQTEPMFRTMAVFFFIGNEGISLIENLGQLGVPLPEFLTIYFEKLKNDNGKDAMN